MTKIKNTSAYPFKIPVATDFVVGTDSDNNGDTVSYRFNDISNLLNSINGSEIVSYTFAISPLGELDENGYGYFLSENNDINPDSITKLIVSNKTKSIIDLSELFSFIKNNNDGFVLKLRNISNPNNFVYFEITDVTEETYQFTFQLSVYNSNYFSGVLEVNNVYGFDFYLKSGGSSENYSQIVYVDSPSPTTATIFDTNNPPITNDNTLKDKVENLYIGNDASTWVYITSPSGYVTKTISNITSNFFLSGTTIDAGINKNSSIERSGTVGGAPATSPNHFVTKAQLDLKGDMTTNTDQTVSGVKTFLAGKFGFRNVANTFTSFFSNANTASRTYTFQNRNGIVADDTDLAGKQNLFSGITNMIPKSINSTTLLPSRVQDTGSYIGIDVSNQPTKDITLSNKSEKTIGVENSLKTIKGRDLGISAGSTVNFNYDSSFLDTNITKRQYNSVAVHPGNRNIYLTAPAGLYVSLAGTGNFDLVSTPVSNLRTVSILPNGDVYIFSAFGSVMRQINGVGAFTAVSGITSRSWESSYSAPNGNMLAVVIGSDIYLRTGGTGDFVPLGQTSRSWYGVCELSNGDRYASVLNGDIYKQTGGTGSFVSTGQTSRPWKDMAVDSSDNVYCVTYGGDIYVKLNGSNTFTAMGQVSRNWDGIFADTNGDIYACTSIVEGSMYIKYASDEGTPNLDGGALILEAGTGKGTGKSRVEIYTGQKLSSGTTMQLKTLRAYYDENGYYINLSLPTYANDAAADADSNLPSKAYYKVTASRGVFQKP